MTTVAEESYEYPVGVKTVTDTGNWSLYAGKVSLLTPMEKGRLLLSGSRSGGNSADGRRAFGVG